MAAIETRLIIETDKTPDFLDVIASRVPSWASGGSDQRSGIMFATSIKTASSEIDGEPGETRHFESVMAKRANFLRFAQETLGPLSSVMKKWTRQGTLGALCE